MKKAVITYRKMEMQDFKTGQTIYTKQGYSFTLTKKYSDGIWECREGAVIFEGEINIYRVIA